MIKSGRDEHDFPLHILLIGSMWHPYFDGPGGPQPRDPKRASRQNALNDLKQEIIRYPGVKCIDMLDNGHHAFGPIREGRVNTIFIDPFGLREGIEESTWIILCIRHEFPEIVFVLFVAKDDLADRPDELYSGPRSRFQHYFHLLQDASATEFGSNVASVLYKCRGWHLSVVEKRPGRNQFKYDVALSFAGEDRHYAEEMAEILKTNGVRVFYDSFEQANLWGKDLFSHLHTVYSKESRFCIMFVSKPYAEKMWTVHERRSAQDRALREREHEYILPLRIDDTELPGLPNTISYLDLNKYDVKRISKLFIVNGRGSWRDCLTRCSVIAASLGDQSLKNVHF